MLIQRCQRIFAGGGLVLHASALLAIVTLCGVQAGAGGLAGTLVGGEIDCNSQEALKDVACEASGTAVCGEMVKKCNQSMGTKKRLCEAESGANACEGTACKTQPNDKLSQNDPDGNPCVVVYN